PLSPGLDLEGLFRAREPGQVIQHRHFAALGLRWRIHRKLHRAVVHCRCVLVEPHRAAEAAVLAHRLEGNRFTHALSTPFDFAVWVAMRSMSCGDNASYGSSPISFRRARMAGISSGRAPPPSMTDDTNAANCSGDQPFFFDSSTCTKSRP